MNWKDRLDKDYNFAKHMILTQGACQPMFIIHTKKEAKIFGVGMQDDKTKDAITMFMRMTALADNAEAVSFLAEGWSKNFPVNVDDKTVAKSLPISQQPDKQEVILVTCSYFDFSGKRHTVSRMGRIERDGKGHPSDVVDLDSSVSDTSGGRFTTILPWKRPTPEQQRNARDVLPFIIKQLGFKFADASTTTETIQ
jgi:hypothetical protein